MLYGSIQRLQSHGSMNVSNIIYKKQNNKHDATYTK